MNDINVNSAVDYTKTLVKRNTAIEIVDAKNSGNPIDKEQIQQSNQDVKDKSKDAGLAVYQAKLTKNTVDTYIQSSENAKNYYSNGDDSSNSNSEIYTFDPKAVNEAQSMVHKRAVGISVYEKIQSVKEPI